VQLKIQVSGGDHAGYPKPVGARRNISPFETLNLRASLQVDELGLRMAAKEGGFRRMDAKRDRMIPLILP